MSGFLFTLGAFGAAGWLFAWPCHLLWILLLAIGWGVLVVDNC